MGKQLHEHLQCQALGVAPQHDVRTPARHVGCYGYSTRQTGLRYDLCFSAYVLWLGVQQGQFLVLDSLIVPAATESTCWNVAISLVLTLSESTSYWSWHLGKSTCGDVKTVMSWTERNSSCKKQAHIQTAQCDLCWTEGEQWLQDKEHVEML